ncbi:thioesterase II family protein [Actinomadura sp. WMMA1423]|uniref:thioesterase II family protein n=1 Tax=Actinomadura sp. WMMA1423 TaxID=2591108 RepID=UPI00114757E0|nr:alpha/beta fold hydrolase [Actinomadura sp. WMMA1423]
MAESTWIRRFHPADGAPTRLVCLPHAGGAASYFFPVSRRLSPGVDVLAVQYPGRQDRRAEPPVDDLHGLADLVAAELLPWSRRPLALFGHSMGATLAFEVAARLEGEGAVPAAVLASGRRSPTRHRDERVHLADDARLIADLRRLSGTSAEMLDDDEVLRMILPAVRADYRAAETYRRRPGTVLSCPVVALTGDDDPQVTREEAAAWRECTTGGFRLEIFPGGHFYLNDHAEALIGLISELLAAPERIGVAAPAPRA